nr:hypothetical protein [Tanacetum cinerariifolium]
APSDDDIQVEDDDEDPEEDPSEEHEPEDDDDDLKEDPNKEHEPEDEDTKEPSEGFDETEPFEEEEIAVTPPPPRHRQGLIRSLGHDTRTIARAADRADDVGYEVNLRVSYQAHVRRKKSVNFYTQLLDARTDRRDIRLEIDVVRGQRTAYETELQERQSAEDLAVTHMMRIHALEARARTDMVEDADSSC